MNVSINQPFKDSLRQRYLTWIADPARELTETGKIKNQIISPAVGVGCMESYPAEHYRQIFQEVLHKQCFGLIRR